MLERAANKQPSWFPWKETNNSNTYHVTITTSGEYTSMKRNSQESDERVKRWSGQSMVRT